MHGDDRWEKPWHSIPIGAMPGEPIGLQSAVKLIIERKSGIGAAEEHSPAISFQPEFMNMWYGGRFMNMWHGGSKLQADLEERSELGRAEEIRTVARDWNRDHLRAGELRLFRDGGRRKLWWVCESQFWQQTDPADVFMQNSILDREGDEHGAYVLDAAALLKLLERRESAPGGSDSLKQAPPLNRQNSQKRQTRRDAIKDAINAKYPAGVPAHTTVAEVKATIGIAADDSTYRRALGRKK